MTLEEYLNAGLEGLPKDGAKGVASEWMPVASLVVKHGSLWAGDPYVCDAEDGCTIDVPNGEYAVEAQGYDFNGTRIIGRVRARSNQGYRAGDSRLDSEKDGRSHVCPGRPRLAISPLGQETQPAS